MYTRLVYTWIVKNITLSADEKVIEAARKKARAANRTLNEEFRRWLDTYACSARYASCSIPRRKSRIGTAGIPLRPGMGGEANTSTVLGH